MASNPKFSDAPFTETMQALLASSGVTYRELAVRTRLSAGYLCHLTHGNREVPTNEVLTRIARALAVRPDHFLEYRLRVIKEKLSPALANRLYRQIA